MAVVLEEMVAVAVVGEDELSQYGYEVLVEGGVLGLDCLETLFEHFLDSGFEFSLFVNYDICNLYFLSISISFRSMDFPIPKRHKIHNSHQSIIHLTESRIFLISSDEILCTFWFSVLITIISTLFLLIFYYIVSFNACNDNFFASSSDIFLH